MYFYKAMSDISRFIPTAGLQNIAEAGANRLAAAQSAESRELSSQGLARSIEAGLGGMKMTTFGGKVFSGIEKEGGAYLKQQVGRLQSAAKDSAGNAWESATSALRARDPVAPTQMDEIGDVGADDLVPLQPAAAGAPATAADGASLFTRGYLGRTAPPPPAAGGGGGAAAQPDVAPPRPTAPKPTDEAPELPDPATKPSVAELAEPETAATGDVGGVASLASSEGGFITGSEALSGVLEATGIGAPLGLIVGAVGVGLALKKDKPVAMQVSNTDTGGFSYQMGI
tara:strand:- start:175 stop:1029 length:855 start_codon:yes stop_codon:yes gene_type:complete